MKTAEAYEAGYRDGSINYELEHCPACKNVADLQEALAENAKLREEFDKMDVWYSKELIASMAENAKLREELEAVGTAAYLYGRTDLEAENATPGTCYDTGKSRIFHCSECGLGMDDVYVDDETLYPPADFPRFCPNCGRKVISK